MRRPLTPTLGRHKLAQRLNGYVLFMQLYLFLLKFIIYLRYNATDFAYAMIKRLRRGDFFFLCVVFFFSKL